MNSTWDYDLHEPPESVNASTKIYIIDLFEANSSLIHELHNLGHKAICYFSAGSYEDWRPDINNFTSNDLGNDLDGWAGEKWLNVSSPQVRDNMAWRMELAREKNCDGVDPDNVDGYENDNGLNLTQEDAVSYIEFLSETGHQKNLAVGLKNGGAIVERVVNITEWVVVEQCIQYNECDMYEPFIEAGKAVFNVEYPKLTNKITASETQHYCDYNGSVGFMTILKKLNLDSWVVACPYRS